MTTINPFLNLTDWILWVAMYSVNPKYIFNARTPQSKPSPSTSVTGTSSRGIVALFSSQGDSDGSETILKKVKVSRLKKNEVW